MTKEVADKIVQELSEISCRGCAVTNEAGFILSEDPDYKSDNQKYIDKNSPRAVRLSLEGKTDGYVHLSGENKNLELQLNIAKLIAQRIISQEIFSDYLTESSQNIDQTFFDYFLAKELNANKITYDLQSMGLKLGINRSVIYIRIINPSRMKIEKPLISEGERSENVKRIKSDISRILNIFYPRYSDNLILYLGSSNFLILKDLGESPKKYEEEFFRTIDLLKYNLTRELRSHLIVGVGKFNEGLDGLRESYNQASAAVNFGEKTVLKRGVFHFDDFGAISPLFSGINNQNIEYIKLVISQLAKNPIMLQTVNEYFKQNLSPSKTAMALKIHRNTLSYRLERVAQLTGLDPRLFSESFQLRLAMLENTYWEKRKETEGVK